MSELTIEVFSDIVCPWCFIGKRNLDQALRELKKEHPEVSPRIRWLPFFLNPDAPLEGEPYRPYLERKFGGAERLQQIWSQITETGKASGIAFAFERIEKSANTLLAHRLIHRTQQQGDADALVEALFAAQFEQGQSIGEAPVLARLAAQCGAQEAETLAWLQGNEGTAEVQAGFERARQLDISGVPFFILDGRFGVGGAQPPDLMRMALRRCLTPQ